MSARSRSPSPDPRSHGRSRSHDRSRSRSASPSTAVAKVRSPSPSRAKLSSAARKAALLSRFSDAYSQTRLDAQCLLRRCIDKAETVQRIIYIAAVVREPRARRCTTAVQGRCGQAVLGSTEQDG